VGEAEASMGLLGEDARYGTADGTEAEDGDVERFLYQRRTAARRRRRVLG